MTKAVAKLVNRPATHRREAASARPVLGPGLHPATLEMVSGESYGARTLAGDLVMAEPAEGVSAALLEECMRSRRTVLLCEGPRRRVLLLGALQTEPSARVDADGNLALAARSIELAAAERVTLRVGGTLLTLEKGGTVRVTGDRMTIDMGAHVQVLSANVSLP